GEDRSQQDLYLLHFLGCTLEDTIRRRWGAVPAEERLQVRQSLFEYLIKTSASLPRWVSVKLCKALVDGGKWSWPLDDPMFLEDIQKLARQDGTRFLGLTLLSLVGEEFVRADVPFPSARKVKLRSYLLAALPGVLAVLTESISSSISFIGSATGKLGDGQTPHAMHITHASEVIQGSTRCLLVFLSWAPLGDHLTVDLFHSLFTVIEAAAQDAQQATSSAAGQGTAALQICGADSVACLTEVLSKRLLPPGQENLVMGMADHMLHLLHIVTQEGVMAACEEHFLLQLAEFLEVFMNLHIGRVLRTGGDGVTNRPRFPVGQLLTLLATFTFGQATTKGLHRCVLAWSAFAQQATIGEGEGSP
ncbi:unnamed protein product, partial [Discosporangium mesarthrocarpum]